MRARDLRRLVGWLEQTGIQSVEYESDDASLRVVMHAQPRLKKSNNDVSRRQPLHIAASENGVFFRAHPCSTAPFVTAGRMVIAGDILGLLKGGEVLYKPVTATQDGRVAHITTSSAALVQEGTVLFELDTMMCTQ